MTPSAPSTRDLEQIQRWMQATIMHPQGVVQGVDAAEARRHIDVGPDEVQHVITRSQSLTALERLAIYSYAYQARLVECLREEFSVLKQALGEEAFDDFAVDYLQKYPSRSYTLAQLGTNFPRYLAESRPTESEGGTLPADWPDFLVDLATLERTFNEVFDGPGVEGQRLLDPDQLAAIGPERLMAARLRGVSCLRLLALRYPVHRYFTAVRRKKAAPLPKATETYLAVTRRAYVVRHYELSRSAYAVLHALLAGETLGQAVGRAVAVAGSDLERLAGNLQTWFRDWAAEGFFSAIELAD